jgi:predicted RNase H-like nuclease (RuvC/YqgF family)
MVFPFKSIHDNMKHPMKNNNDSADSSSLKGSVGEGSGAASTNVKKRITVIDETLLPQDEAEKLLAKRAYNRDCAERARKRSKQMTEELHCKVKELQEDKHELRRTLVNMEKQLKMLQKQNDELLLEEMQRSTTGRSPRHDCVASFDQMGTTALNALSHRSTLYPPLLIGSGVHPKLIPSWDYNSLLHQFRK